jgi:hydrogenase/urease accessory protein HupE
MNLMVPIISLVLLLLLPNVASAHLVTTGLGPFYDGITHMLLSPDDLVGVLVLSLLAGMNGSRTGRIVLFSLPLVWLAGGFLGLQAASQVSMPYVNAVFFFLLGALVAVDRRLPPILLLIFTIGLGMFHGYMNGTAMQQAGAGPLSLFGIVVVVFVLVALIAAFVVSLQAYWTRIAVRVAGSWIAAIGLLMLGWTIRGGV